MSTLGKHWKLKERSDKYRKKLSESGKKWYKKNKNTKKYEDRCEKISKTLKYKYENNIISPPNKNKKFSKSHILELKQSHKGQKAWNKGKKTPKNVIGKMVNTRRKNDSYKHTEEQQKKIKETKIKNGTQVPDELLSPFNLYKRKVKKQTNKHKKRLFENWDGYCCYSKKYIKNKPKWSKYEPTIDHIKSIFYGFKNNINPEIIGGYNNLCICSRSENAQKNR